ncbi:LIM domain kinase 1-like [Eucalyptus grandis]|uniref:LIM domain kinase 1-like n=1 Tax=Eucalyptus grandis TaxID=71139 RepID=UPI00192EF9E0|nr:LIM domain kinase 1-like [Eucalyptus grandis]
MSELLVSGERVFCRAGSSLRLSLYPRSLSPTNSLSLSLCPRFFRPANHREQPTNQEDTGETTASNRPACDLPLSLCPPSSRPANNRAALLPPLLGPTRPSLTLCLSSHLCLPSLSSTANHRVTGEPPRHPPSGSRSGTGLSRFLWNCLSRSVDVVVKVFSMQEYSEELINSFRQEASLMKRLRHPNVLLFMGAVTSPQRLCIVTEFLPRGSLFRLLQRNTAKLDWRRCVHMALDV